MIPLPANPRLSPLAAARDAENQQGKARRTISLDPDFRRDPKTHTFCALCQKDLKPGTTIREIFTTSQVDVAYHPADVLLGAMPKEFSWYPIGMECARKLGLEWSKPAGKVQP